LTAKHQRTAIDLIHSIQAQVLLLGCMGWRFQLFSDRAQNWAQRKIDALDAEADSRSKMKEN
jgi:hypothetical protein